MVTMNMSAFLCMYAFEARSSCQLPSVHYMRAKMSVPSSVSFAEVKLGKRNGLVARPDVHRRGLLEYLGPSVPDVDQEM